MIMLQLMGPLDILLVWKLFTVLNYAPPEKKKSEWHVFSIIYSSIVYWTYERFVLLFGRMFFVQLTVYIWLKSPDLDYTLTCVFFVQ